MVKNPKIKKKIQKIIFCEKKRDCLHRETMDFHHQHSYSQLPEHFIWKGTMDISLAPGGAAEPQGQVVQVVANYLVIEV